MLKYFVLIALSTSLFIKPAFANTHHFYKKGKVFSISNSKISVSGEEHQLGPNANVIIQKRNHGAYYQSSTKLTDVRVGDTVHIKLFGNIVDEIVIEGWKR
jgi:hypothetical protein